MARQPIVDSHIHFWDPNRFSYPWLQNVPAINRPFLPTDLIEQATDVDLQGIIFVQAGAADEHGLAEARWVSELARQEPRIRGIVAFAPLEMGEGARPYLDELSKLQLVKGVRRLVQSEDEDFCTRPDFIRGVQQLPEYGFSFDLCIRHEQMESAIQMADECRGVRIVLDHFGKPAVRRNVMDPWRAQLVELARLPHVTCKISGLATEADHDDWTRHQLRPYIEHALNAFGLERVMYGGDWPVSTLAIEYQEWIDTINWATDYLEDVDRQKLFVDNALSFYRIE